MNKLNITKDFENKLLKRKEIEAVLTSDKNPGMANAAEEVAKHFKADSTLVVIKKVDGRFGRDTFNVSAMIYNSVSDKERVERKKKEKKKVEGAN